MCTEIYIGVSTKEDLSTHDKETGFWVAKVKDKDHFSKIALKVENIYEIGSYMGCSCGLAFGEGLENENKRKQNCLKLKSFLEKNLSVITGMVTFYDSLYNGETGENFPEHTFNLKDLEHPEEFYFKDDVIYSTLK